MTLLSKCAGILCMLVAIGPLEAQTAPDSIPKKPLSPPPDMRRGLYGSVGVGYGMGESQFQVNGSTASGSHSNVTFYAGAGWTLNRRLRLGVEWSYFGADQSANLAYEATNGTAMFYSAAATYYPSATTDLWIKGALGYATLGVSNYLFSQSEGGLAGGLGVGYDARIGRSSYVFTPFVNYFGQFSSHAFSPDPYMNSPAGRIWLLQTGIGIGYRH